MAADTRIDNLSSSTVHAGERLILDTIVCAIGGSDVYPTRVVSDYVLEQSGAGPASVVGSGRSVGAANATRVNAFAANILDADETLQNFGHSACAIVPAALAVAQQVGATGRDLVEAVIVGYELANRVGLSVRRFGTDQHGNPVASEIRGWSWAGYGAAVAAARLLRCDERQIEHAVGAASLMLPLHRDLAGYYSSQFHSSDPAFWSKYAMYGDISATGVDAAQLAKRGFASERGVFDPAGRFWLNLGGVKCDYEFMSATRDGWLVEEAAFKIFPLSRLAAPILDCFERIMSSNSLELDSIERIVVRIPPFPRLEEMCTLAWPSEGLRVMHSVPYALAMIGKGIPPGPRWWSNECLSDTHAQRFARRVELDVDPSLPSMQDQLTSTGLTISTLPTAVEVQTKRRVYREAADRPRGEPAPRELRLSDNELIDKAANYAGDHLGQDRARRLAEFVLRLRTASDLGSLTTLMSGNDGTWRAGRAMPRSR